MKTLTIKCDRVLVDPTTSDRNMSVTITNADMGFLSQIDLSNAIWDVDDKVLIEALRNRGYNVSGHRLK